MKMGAKFLAAAAVLGLTGFAQAASISLIDLGNVDTTGMGGAVHPEFQVYQFKVAKTTETSKINALDLKVTATSPKIHQIWGEGLSFGNKIYTASPKYGDIGDPPQSFADSHLDPYGTGLWALTVVPAAENMVTVVPGNNGTTSYTGPASTIDPEVVGGGYQAGFGTTFKFVGAVPGGSEENSYTVYQLILPDDLAGNIVTVHIEATAPGHPIFISEFVFGGAPVVIPVPAAYPLGLAGLGLLAALRRRRHA